MYLPKLLVTVAIFSAYWFCDVCGEESSETRIIGGIECVKLIGLRTDFAISIRVREYYGQDDHGCGGSLIADVWVLTAAHCLKCSQKVRNIYAVQADTITKTGFFQGKGFKIIQRICHPQHALEPTIYDIGLAKIESPTWRIRPIKIPKKKFGFFHGLEKTCPYPLAMGLGTTEKDKPADQLMCVNLTMLPTNDSYPMKIVTRSAQGVHFGDSGGPLVCSNTLVGEATTMYHLPEMKFSYFTRLDWFLDFIHQTMGPPYYRSCGNVMWKQFFKRNLIYFFLLLTFVIYTAK